MRILMIFLVMTMVAACGADAENNQNNGNNANNANNANNSNNANTTNNTNNVVPTTFYYEDVKPILDHSCTACHMSNGIGPFALTTYEEVSSVAGLIKNAVTSRTMPPFLPSPGCNEYLHDPSLNDTQIETIATWVDEGAAMGQPENEGAPIPGAMFTPPDFDTDLVMAEPYTPQKSPDDYRCFVIDWPHDTQKFITGFGVVPGEPSIVHTLHRKALRVEVHDAPGHRNRFV